MYYDESTIDELVEKYSDTLFEKGIFADPVRVRGDAATYTSGKTKRTYMSYFLSYEFMALLLIQDYIKKIRKNRQKGVSDNTIVRKISRDLYMDLYKNADFSKYAENNLSKQDIFLIHDFLKSCTKEELQELENDYNRRHKIMTRDKIYYTDDELDILHRAAAMTLSESTVLNAFSESANSQPYKSYPNTYIGQKITAGGESIERPLIKYIMSADRISKNSEAFRQIQSDIKTRQTSAILYRVLMMPNVVLAMADKELPASFKVFRAADVRANDKEPKVFIDLTGIIKLNNGIFVCSKIDTLVTYLTAALVQLLYYSDSKQLVNNASITRPATVCFVKLFTGVIDELRVIGYAENQLKIKYNTAIYFLTSLVGKPMENARSMAANILGINPKEAKAYDYFYADEAMENLNTFVTDLCDNFKLKGFGTDIMLDRWMFKYGKGTMYGLELYPAFLTMLTNAYCGTYINNQKTIEKYCGKDMVTIATTIIRMGADIYSEGAKYVRTTTGIELK